MTSLEPGVNSVERSEVQSSRCKIGNGGGTDKLVLSVDVDANTDNSPEASKPPVVRGTKEIESCKGDL
jgi:hypothetical protein